MSLPIFTGFLKSALPHRCHQPLPALPTREAEFQLSYAEGWLALGLPDEAEREFSQLSVPDQSTPRALRLGVQIAVGLNLPEEALRLGIQLAQCEPEQPDGWMILTRVALNICGRTDWAMKILREAHGYLPNDPDIKTSLDLLVEICGELPKIEHL
ncbi:MAG TPA: hypothetical protein VMF06_05865 [Candidatus Limnocylindria bacterium]|jgi:hypothetical protein|nr:hypothetical protein [Candidatus Limnocylindria bacterium]